MNKLEVLGMEDYWAVKLDGKIINSFDTEEEADTYAREFSE
jgi:hypothetical protein